MAPRTTATIIRTEWMATAPVTLTTEQVLETARARGVSAFNTETGERLLVTLGRHSSGSSEQVLPLSTLRALEEQMTPELIAELWRYAQSRAKLVRRAGRPVSETYARELVDDVHADIRVGDLPWDPRYKLLDQLKAAIKKRTWLEIRHARRVSFVSLQEVANDETISPEMENALARAAGTDCEPIMLYAITATVCQQLGPLVSRDVDAAAIVKCWTDGVMDKDTVLRLTGLTEAAYKSARERLRNTCRGLPSALREAAQDLLRSAATTRRHAR